jgi:hypothetical protein
MVYADANQITTNRGHGKNGIEPDFISIYVLG